jgi:hypothetical protein
MNIEKAGLSTKYTKEHEQDSIHSFVFFVYFVD